MLRRSATQLLLRRHTSSAAARAAVRQEIASLTEASIDGGGAMAAFRLEEALANHNHASIFATVNIGTPPQPLRLRRRADVDGCAN